MKRQAASAAEAHPAHVKRKNRRRPALVGVYVEQHVKRDLQAAAAYRNMTLSDYVREMLEQRVAEQRRALGAGNGHNEDDNEGE